MNMTNEQWEHSHKLRFLCKNEPNQGQRLQVWKLIKWFWQSKQSKVLKCRIFLYFLNYSQSEQFVMTGRFSGRCYCTYGFGLIPHKSQTLHPEAHEVPFSEDCANVQNDFLFYFVVCLFLFLYSWCPFWLSSLAVLSLLPLSSFISASITSLNHFLFLEQSHISNWEAFESHPACLRGRSSQLCWVGTSLQLKLFKFMGKFAEHVIGIIIIRVDIIKLIKTMCEMGVESEVWEIYLVYFVSADK